jgi:hypothetical protein
MTELFEIFLVTVSANAEYARALILAGTMGRCQWDDQQSLEYIHRLVLAVTIHEPRAIPAPAFMRLLANSRIAQPLVIIQTIAAHFETFSGKSTDQEVFRAFLGEAIYLTADSAAPAYVQVLYSMFCSHCEICRENSEAFRQAIYHVLATNNPQAVHDVYALYSLFYTDDWPIEDNLLLAHLQIPQVQYVLLFLLCLDSAVKSTVSQFLNVHLFLAEFIRLFPEFVGGVSSLIATFPIGMATTSLLVRSGLLECLNVVAFSSEIAGDISAVLAIHAAFDWFVLPRDFRELIEHLKEAAWAGPLFARCAAETVRALSLHMAARQSIVEFGLTEILQT